MFNCSKLTSTSANQDDDDDKDANLFWFLLSATVSVRSKSSWTDAVSLDAEQERREEGRKTEW